MSDKKFERMDEQWMKATKDLREKKVSDGMLKGFSTSVERRILSKEQFAKRAWSPAWVPAMAVLVIAFAAVLHLPQSVDYAQLPNTASVDDEIAVLKEVGAWNDEDEALLGVGDEAGMEDLELSNLSDGKINIA